ncbi:MAG: hypothetical protein ACN4GZ_12130 [Acidimicrobiales bacterium]
MITTETAPATGETVVATLRNSGAALREEDALAKLTMRVRSLLMSDPVTQDAQRQSLMTAAYDISIALEWIEVRVRHDGYSTAIESELLVLALEVSVLEQEWFCGDH